jgi:hypothetical protein
MKTLRIILMFWFFSFLSLQMNGQVKSNSQKLLQFSTEKTTEFNQAKAEAREYARKNNMPMIIETDSSYMEMMYIDASGRPQYYITSNINAAKTISTNKVHPGGGFGFSLDGTGMTVHEWDGGAVLATHQEFGSRVTQGDGVTATNYHSTHVAGTMIASGVDTSAKGMAMNANLKAFDWNNDNAEMAAEAASGALVSNHSYGYQRGWGYLFGFPYWWGDPSISDQEDYLFGFYDSYSHDWDQIAYDAPYYLIVKSAGNDRNDCGDGSYPCDGPYDCIGELAIAKNILTIGAVEDIPAGYSEPSDVVMSYFSSWGPADDGRIKPDIVSNGISLYSTDDNSNTAYTTLSGTSMASPTVTGSLILLQEYYEDIHGSGNYMTAATLKALVIHTADEAGDDLGPDYEYGWGLMNTYKAADLILHENGSDIVIDELTLNEGGTYQYSFTNTATDPIQITIAWTDPPGTPPAAALDPPDIMLVNDLDLKVSESDTTFYPWKLDGTNPADAATKTNENDVDNVEVVLIEDPVPNAVYTVTVDHDGNLEGGSQDFSIIISPLNNPETIVPLTLPFVEDFELENGQRGNTGKMYYQADRKWDFETNIDNSHLISWGSNADDPLFGDGAMTTEYYTVAEGEANSDAILTINLENYLNADDLALSFYFRSYFYHHNGSIPYERIYVRGSDSDNWMLLYEFDISSLEDGTVYYLHGLDIDSTLSAAVPAQDVSSSFQIRFSSSFYELGKNVTYDMISITETPADMTGKFIDSGQELGTSNSTDIALGDMDNDGDLDAVVTKAGNGRRNEVWLNDGAGNFTNSGIAFGNSTSWGVALGDLDGDAVPDVFVANNGPNKVYLNKGASSTNNGQNLGNTSSRDVVLADVDGDGDLDAVVANNISGEPNKAWINDGNGIFNYAGLNFGSGTSYGLAMADLDADGDPDGFIANDGSDKVYLNNGSSAIDNGQNLGNSSSKAVQLGDMDNDGDMDALVANDVAGQPNKVWLNNGNSWFFDSGLDFGSNISMDVALADLDNDGDLDGFMANNGANKVYLNDGINTTDNGQFLGNSNSYGVALGDLDGDGDIDAFVANYDGPCKVWMNQTIVGKAAPKVAESSTFVKSEADELKLLSYPNPFSNTTTLSFSLENPAKTSLKIYNSIGQLVYVIFEGYATAGQEYSFVFDANSLPEGFYICRLQSGNSLTSEKILLER